MLATELVFFRHVHERSLNERDGIAKVASWSGVRLIVFSLTVGHSKWNLNCQVVYKGNYAAYMHVSITDAAA